MPSTKVTVWDATGAACEVWPLDAAEIIAAGGSATAPAIKEFATLGVTYSDEDAAAQCADETDETPAEESPKRRRRGR